MLINAGVPRTGKQTCCLPIIVVLASFLAAGALEYVLVCPAASEVLLAQRADPPNISVAPTVLAEPESLVRVPIQIRSTEALPKDAFVRVRGVPWSVSLTEGYSIGPGVWTVPLPGLPGLKANIPAGVSGRSEIVITLVGVDGAVLAEARTALVIGTSPMQAIEPAVPRKSFGFVTRPAPPAGGMRPSELSPEDKTRAEQLVAQGDKYLADANIEVARQFFRRAADAGLAAAAIRLGASYDPAELARLHVLGVVPDRAEARKWYERARELGALEAKESLARLGVD
jgi:hypothetical protein